MSEILDESRDRMIQLFASTSKETREEQLELTIQRSDALKSLSDDELEAALDAIKERESELMVRQPDDELILLSDLKDYPMIQSLRYDMEIIQLEKVRRGLAPAVFVGFSEVQ